MDTRTSWCVLGTNFQLYSTLAALLIVVDIVIYYPFLKVYDEQILEEERSGKLMMNQKEGSCRLSHATDLYSYKAR